MEEAMEAKTVETIDTGGQSASSDLLSCFKCGKKKNDVMRFRRCCIPDGEYVNVGAMLLPQRLRYEQAIRDSAYILFPCCR